MTRRQCKKCPWRVDVDANDIPGEYCIERHAKLTSTIATPGEIRLAAPMRMMACHETQIGKELPCVGWLAHQLGPGNNIGLRLAVITGRVNGDIETVGPQHPTLEDTLPKRPRRKRRRR